MRDGAVCTCGEIGRRIEQRGRRRRADGREIQGCRCSDAVCNLYSIRTIWALDIDRPYERYAGGSKTTTVTIKTMDISFTTREGFSLLRIFCNPLRCNGFKNT